MTEEKSPYELHLEYRPLEFDEYLGNEALKSSVLSVIDRAHTYIFYGPRGCGKTTMARLIAKKVGAADIDIYEIDAADKTGVDDARQIKANSGFAPMGGKSKVYIVDECFASGTGISTIDGDRDIKDIKIGDEVRGIDGFCKVKNIFKNKVSLDRVVKVIFENGKSIFCSKDHLYFTENGWRAIYLLKNNFIFSLNSNTMDSNRLLFKEEDNEKRNQKSMRVLQKGIYNISKKNKDVFIKLCSEIKKSTKWSRFNWRKTLRDLWKDNAGSFISTQIKEKKVLFSALCRNLEDVTRIFSGKDSQSSGKQKDFGKSFEPFKRKEGSIIKIQFRTDEEKQPVKESIDDRKRTGDEKNQWNFACLVGRAWRKWQACYSTAITSRHCFGMADGSCYQDGESSLRQERISFMLQDGYRESGIEIGNRSGRSWAQIEEQFTKRSKEGNEIERVRVESIEIYKRGDNGESFKGIIDSKEVNQEYVEFYDLEIDGHPSYFANGILVHNCHRLSGNAADALLKTLEEPPAHCYFILCTTEIEKVSTTIKSRAKSYEVKPLSTKEAEELLDWVCKEERIKLPSPVRQAIIDNCDGIPREMLVALDMVRKIDREEDAVALILSSKSNPKVIDLCRALLQKSKWAEIGRILKDIADEPEGVRYAVLGYMNAVLLKGDNKQAALVMMIFKDSFMYSRRPGLTIACYQAIMD